MALAEQNTSLVARIKQIIETHYQNLPKKHLNEKVRTEIIPILITLFFEASSQEIQNGSSKSIFGNKDNIINCLQASCLQEGQLGGEKLCRHIVENNKQNISSPLTGEGIFSLLSLNQVSCQGWPVEALVKKSVALCKIIGVFDKLETRKQNCCQIFRFFQERREKIKRLEWLNTFSFKNWIRQSIHRFNANSIKQKKQTEACRRLHKFTVARIKAYLSILFNNSQRLAKKRTDSCEQLRKLRLGLVTRGLSILVRKYHRNLRQSHMRIKRNNYACNPWRTSWVRNIVFRTPANLQTSFWRLINFCKNQNAQGKEEEARIAVPQTSSMPQVKISQLEQQEEREQMSRKMRSAVGTKSEQIEAMLFTREQKAEILWKQLELIYNLFSIESIIQAYSAMESYSAQGPDSSVKRPVLEEFQAISRAVGEKCGLPSDA